MRFKPVFARFLASLCVVCHHAAYRGSEQRLIALFLSRQDSSSMVNPYFSASHIYAVSNQVVAGDRTVQCEHTNLEFLLHIAENLLRKLTAFQKLNSVCPALQVRSKGFI